MKGQPATTSAAQIPELPPISEPKEQTKEQQAAAIRRLKPHSKSQLNLEKSVSGMTPIPAKKSRPTKWQFGIRSRNQPAEAMLAIYKALYALGADWEVTPSRRRHGSRSHGSQGSSASRSHSRSSSLSSEDRREAEEGFSSSDDEIDPESGRSRTLRVRNASSSNSQSRSGDRDRGRQRMRYGPKNDWGYGIPEDPWIINARFRKAGMLPPGVLHASSAHSSRVDLAEAGLRRRSSTAGSSTASLTSNNVSANPSPPDEKQDGIKRDRHPEIPDRSVYVYLTIQLYSIEKDTFVVDFKCAGYERLIREVMKQVKQSAPEGVDVVAEDHPRNNEEGDDTPANEQAEEKANPHAALGDAMMKGAGRTKGEKRATSPFPFLDVASRLIIQLAEG
jgi:carbon catabolite-derepressing protein kinase